MYNALRFMDRQKPWRAMSPAILGSLVIAKLTCGVPMVQAGDGAINLASPSTATNAALHYQRGLLFLASVDPAKRAQLEQPIWELAAAASDAEQVKALNDLLYESRHAIRSALIGSSQADADFGIDPGQYVVAHYVPHAGAMIDLGKLVLLHGMQLEANGKWEEAAETYVRAFAIARHMTRQQTLAEVLAGMQLLEANYYVTSRWAVNCPERSLIEDLALLLNVYAKDAVDPARTMIREFQMLRLQLETLRNAFPDGPWAEMVLAEFDVRVPGGNDSEIEAAARQAAVEQGLPAGLLDDEQAFTRYIDELEATHLNMARQTAAALTHRGRLAVEAGQAVFDEFSAALQRIGDGAFNNNPAQIAAQFATHDAEQMLARIILVLAAHKHDGLFPKDLTEVADHFGGQVPRSPYDGSPVMYELLDDGAGFDISVPKVTVGEIELPQIGFRFEPPRP